MHDKTVHMFWVPYDQGYELVVNRASLDSRIRFYCRKLENSSFFKNDTPNHPNIAYNFTTFKSLTGVVFDSENFLEEQLVSIMPSKLLYGVIALKKKTKSVSSDSNLFM